jgi:hypothetical protein
MKKRDSYWDTDEEDFSYREKERKVDNDRRTARNERAVQKGFYVEERITPSERTR